VCGIVGMIRRDGGLDSDALIRSRDLISHRGPDDAGIWIGDGARVGLGHRRLSIIDLSANGHQPMCNEDGSIWLVYNGEIYNFQSIRRELVAAGHQFRSQTDTEVIIHAYEEWGPESVRRFRGMFAFAIWDQNRRQLMLVRDRLGIKPLYFWHEAGDLTFGSELKGVAADTRVPRALDETAIYDFFTYRYVPTPKTIYRDIRKLPPAHYAILKDAKLTLTQYWDPPFGRSKPVSEAEAVERLRDKLEESVNLHMIADVPVGVLLSGGLDSGSISAFAASETATPLHTFTIGFDVPQHDETAFARMVAERYQTAHHELTVTRDMAISLRDEIVGMYDEPFADSSAIPTFYVSKFARGWVKVALSGEGGDELFGGYKWYDAARRTSRGDLIPQPVRRAINAASRLVRPGGGKGAWTLGLAALDPIERYAKLLGALLKVEKRHRLSPKFMAQFEGYDDYWQFRRFWREDLDPLSRMQYLDMKTYLNDDILTKVDRASMAVSLEARVPLLDHELIETVLGLGVEVRNRDWEKKYLLKKAMATRLPSTLLSREKRGFSIPLYQWLKEPTIADLGPIYDGMFDTKSLFGEQPLTGSDLWPVIVMNRWLCAHA
jgi:asparagine synthase (glutamine-hydrolysing)